MNNMAAAKFNMELENAALHKTITELRNQLKASLAQLAEASDEASEEAESSTPNKRARTKK